jgi:hypothetical protein
MLMLMIFIQVIEKLDIIPLGDDLSHVISAAGQFHMFDQALLRNVPEIMLCIMESMSEYYKELKARIMYRQAFQDFDTEAVSCFS